MAGSDRANPLRALRHAVVMVVYKATKDLFLTQRFARRASPLTTVTYTHASDEDLLEGVRDLVC